MEEIIEYLDKKKQDGSIDFYYIVNTIRDKGINIHVSKTMKSWFEGFICSYDYPLEDKMDEIRKELDEQFALLAEKVKGNKMSIAQCRKLGIPYTE